MEKTSGLKGFGLTCVMWLGAHFSVPSAQDLANYATFFAGIIAGLTTIYNHYIKKNKK